MVDKLTKSQIESWDENPVKHYFAPIDQQRILQLPLHQENRENAKFRYLNQKGAYSVRNGYSF